MNFDKTHISIRSAGKDELATVFGLLLDAAVWLKDMGIDYWQMWLEPNAAMRIWVTKGFDAHEFYFVELSGTIVGMFRLQWSDAVFWGNRLPDSGYIHSFTTVRRYAGSGIGYFALERIETMCRAEGKLYLRLDCGESVAGLRKYYERFGFVHVGDVTAFNERLVLYQKAL
jgi:GNAT superfamily N-acetyltransferase